MKARAWRAFIVLLAVFALGGVVLRLTIHDRVPTLAFWYYCGSAR
ncbi:MAG: hypothetical protein ABI680_09295 [Chthoniobacteraceae bacterium]